MTCIAELDDYSEIFFFKDSFYFEKFSFSVGCSRQG